MQQLEQVQMGIITFSRMCLSAGLTPWHWALWWRRREKPLQLSEQKQLQGLRVLCRAHPRHSAVAVLAKTSFFFLHSWTDTFVIIETSSIFPNCSTHVPSELCLTLLSSRWSKFPHSATTQDVLIVPLLFYNHELSFLFPFPKTCLPFSVRTTSSPGPFFGRYCIRTGTLSAPLAFQENFESSNLQPKVTTLLLLKPKNLLGETEYQPARQAGRTKEIIQWDMRRMKIVFLISFTANLQYVFHITYF